MKLSSSLSPRLTEIAEEALRAFPELHHNYIHLAYHPTIKSTMQARPRLDLAYKSKKERSYQVLVRPYPSFEPDTHIEDLPNGPLLGWFAHEFGHLMDYLNRGRLSMLRFLLGYVFSSSYCQKAERVADQFAINHGMGRHIIETKQFLLEHSGLSDKYRLRLEQHYLSPSAAIKLVEAWEGPLLEER